MFLQDADCNPVADIYVSTHRGVLEMEVSTRNHEIPILQVLLLDLTSSYLSLKLIRSNLLYKADRLALISMYFFFK